MLVTVTAPANEAVTLQEVKDRLRVEHTDDDAQITQIIAAVTANLLRHGRATTTGTYSVTSAPGRFAPSFPSPMGEVQSVTHYDADDVETVIAAADYYVDYVLGQVMPTSHYAGYGERIVFVVEAGYGEDASDVPADLREGIIRQACDLYASPESFVIGTVAASLPVPDYLASYIHVPV